ncbi:MAG: transcriptional regulator [Candidatus Melainabacteria bacterium RIFCSPHIGHO2_02_FULL_34_12]|nr:MAG: transcriptional regulator [Candidatus Melainabacteria bacterium RIFCSPHIGHO2_02_FULL_34_12]
MTGPITIQNRKISIVDLGSHYQTIKDEVEKVVLEVLASGHYVLGKNVLEFENELANYLKCKHVISCANGTDAISLALMALDIKPDDEIITVSHSFFATSEAIALVGAKPVFVDIREDDFNIDPSKIESLINKKTKAILPVHLYGQGCEISSVIEIAKRHGLYVIEDTAQALGAQFQGKYLGTFGDIGTISFFPTKNLGAFGDGGAICTNNDVFAEKLKQLRVHGSSKRYIHEYIGLNSRLDEIQAAILRVGLKYLDKWNSQREAAAKYYNELLKDIELIILPAVKPNCRHVFHQYTIRTKRRDYLYEKLREKGIETIIYYPVPIHLQKAFKYLKYKEGSLPITEKLCNEILSLPMYPEIKKEIQEYIAENIKLIFKKQ